MEGGSPLFFLYSSFYNRTVYLEYDREACNDLEALISVIEDINIAGFEISTIQESGLASVSEMAARAGVGRSTINNYVKGTKGDGTFPAPLYDFWYQVRLYTAGLQWRSGCILVIS